MLQDRKGTWGSTIQVPHEDSPISYCSLRASLCLHPPGSLVVDEVANNGKNELQKSENGKSEVIDDCDKGEQKEDVAENDKDEQNAEAVLETPLPKRMRLMRKMAFQESDLESPPTVPNNIPQVSWVMSCIPPYHKPREGDPGEHLLATRTPIISPLTPQLSSWP